MYKNTNLENNFTGLEKEILEFWKQNGIIEKNLNMNEGKKPFTFYDGPPTANGMPHAGHILTRVIKDIIPRYKVMKGYNVERKAGWDTHGLPVELEIEKQIGISGKEQIEEYGVEKFNKLCKESVFKYVSIWEEMTDKVGFWVDMDDPYITYDNNYIESVWWALSKLFSKGLLYEGHKVMPYCPRCGTALSSHEVSQGYKDVKDLTATVMFKIKGEDRYLLAWTTTPWTLPSNIAVVVNKKYEYADVKVDLNSKENNSRIAKVKKEAEKAKEEKEYEVELLEPNYRTLVLAKELIEEVLKDYDYEIVKTYVGKDLVGIKYERLLDFGKVDGKAFEVIHGDFVNLKDGTGLVHAAPAFGEDDNIICKKNDFGFINLVDTEGKFKNEVEPWKGRFVRDTNEDICKYLEEEGKLFKKEKQEHSYPHCWRCDTPLLYYPKKSWFVKMSSLRDELLENNYKVNWMPATIGTGRFGNFLENVIDWSISRDRYWGTPLPVWKCEDCGHVDCIGSIEELKEKAIEKVEDIELHKPYVDKITMKCPKCGKIMKREPEVIDCWFDSGSMPYAQLHYPFENQDKFKKMFPAQFISEAIDQTRGWFYTLMALGTSLFDQNPYENVIVLGHVLDGKGQKMSKSKKNGVDPLVLLDEVGADATRWYFFNGSQPWISSRLSIENVQESQRAFILTLYNAYAFYVLYANIDKFDPTKYDMKNFEYKDVMDKWIISKVNTLTKNVDKMLEKYDINGASKEIENFTDELSNWYIRRNRKRFWAKGMEEDKISCYMALYVSLKTLIQVSAPFIPFVTEEIYQNIVRRVEKDANESIHLNLWPEVCEDLIDTKLEEEMELAYSIVKLGRNIRNTNNIKNRQPLSKMLISENLPEYYTNIIKEELNIKEVALGANMNDYVVYDVKPNLPVLGKTYGKLIPQITKKINEMDQTELANKLFKGDEVIFDVEDNKVIISNETAFATMQGKEGYAFASDNTIGVVIDTEITEELKKEGYLRELLSKIQNLRKEKGFEVTDRINIEIYTDEYLTEIIKTNEDKIKKATLAKNLKVIDEKDKDETEDYVEEKINDKSVFIVISKN